MATISGAKLQCWNNHALKRPGNPDLLIFVSHSSRSFIVFCFAAVSFRLLLKVLPKLLIGFSLRVGIVSPATVNWTISMTLPFFNTSDLDFAGLKYILAQVIFLSRPFKSHLPSMRDVIITVKSCKPLLVIGGLLI